MDIDNSPHRLAMPLAAAAVLSLCTSLSACASELTDVATADAGETTQADSEPRAAPTYAELYDTYFAKGTPGHCATAGCHADPGHNVWLCGADADTCYKGMTDMGLIDRAHPEKSSIGDPKRSPITWINATGGTMPLDAQGANAEAKAAIGAWLAAGAPEQ